MDDHSLSKNTNGVKSTYSLPGVVNYLQSEFRRFEREKAEWEVQRAELMTKIANLEGQCRVSMEKKDREDSN